MLYLDTLTTCKHTDSQVSRMTRNEEDVKSLMTMLDESWINPFKDEQQDLVCVSTANALLLR